MTRTPSLFHSLLLVFTIVGASCNQQTEPITAISCELPQEELRSIASKSGEVDIRDCVIPEKADSADLSINATFRDFTPAQELKMRNALERLKLVINSEEFRQEVLNYTYQGQFQFVDNRGMSNLEIYNSILKGAETLNGIIDSEMDIDITMYYANNTVVGYTYPNVTRIWVNNKFFSTNSLGKVAANVVHEWTHKIGFGHDFNRTARRPFSVPYAVGSIIQRLVDRM